MIKLKDIQKNDYIGIKGSYFDDNFPRGFEVKEDDKSLYIKYADGEEAYIKDLPLHLITILDKKNFAPTGIFT